MPLYEYRCADGCEVTILRKISERDHAVICEAHTRPMQRKVSVPAKRTDGIYSYAPNIGDPDVFERRHAEATERGERVKEMKESSR